MAQDSLGNRIKQRRHAQKLTLRELAARTELTASFISQVERGQTNPSLDSLRRIAEALQVSVLHFLPDAAQSSNNRTAALKYLPVVRSRQRPKLILPASGVSYELLTPDLSRKMEAFCGRLAPGTGNVARRLREPTEEFIYVLAGSLLIGLDADEYVLKSGDSIYFEGTQLQKLECASTDEVIWISVITPPAF